MDEKHVKMIEDIHTALVGNQYNKRGLISRVDSVERKVEKHSRYWGLLIGIGTLTGFAAAFWSDITSIFK